MSTIRYTSSYVETLVNSVENVEPTTQPKSEENPSLSLFLVLPNIAIIGALYLIVSASHLTCAYTCWQNPDKFQIIKKQLLFIKD